MQFLRFAYFISTLIIIIALGLTFLILRRSCPVSTQYAAVPVSSGLPQEQETQNISVPDSLSTAIEPIHKPHSFDFGIIKGLSKKQLSEHEKLYQGYVKKRNEIARSLVTVDRSDTASSYSPLRGLKIAETFALNGAVLHELYFENLGGKSTPGPQTTIMINENFGSFEQFKKDLFDCANCSRGWVMTGFFIEDKKVYNFVLDAHNQTVPVLTLPLLMVDVYEHAYMIDFGINRKEYLNIIWDNINWDVVEERIDKWVNKFKIYE